MVTWATEAHSKVPLTDFCFFNHARFRRERATFVPSIWVLFWGFPRSCLPRLARRGAARGSAIQGLGKGGALSLVLIVQATAEEVHGVIVNPGYVEAMH